MSQNEIITKIEALNELEAFMEEIKNEAETLRDAIKADMMEKGLEEMEAGKFIVRWTPVFSNRFDTAGFKKLYADLYKTYTKQVSSRRFTISC